MKLMEKTKIERRKIRKLKGKKGSPGHLFYKKKK